MSEEILNKILGKIEKVEGQNTTITEKLEKVEDRLENVENRIGKVENQIDFIAIKVVNIEEKIDTFATKDEMNEKFGLVLNNIDRFIKLHETLDQELAMLRNKYNRLEERIIVLEQKMQTA